MKNSIPDLVFSMSEKLFKKKDKPEELIRAKQLIDEYKLDEADQLIKNFEEKGGHSLHDIVLCYLLKCELLCERGLYEDVVKLAEQTYKESLGLGNNLLSVDILLIMAMALLCLGYGRTAKNFNTRITSRVQAKRGVYNFSERMGLRTKK